MIPEPYLTLLSGSMTILVAVGFFLIGRLAVSVWLLRHTVYAICLYLSGFGCLLIARGLGLMDTEQGRYWILFITLWSAVIAVVNLTVATKMRQV